MRINRVGLQFPNDRIVAIVLDEIFDRVWQELQGKYDFDVWAFRHEDDTFTLHWSVDGVLIPLDSVPIEPMSAFANPNPYVTKIIETLEESGIS